MRTFLNEIIEILIKKELTLATCESVTGGMIGSNIISVGGASKVYLGGLTAYSKQIKIQQAKVPPQIIQNHGTISKETAIAMAEGAKVKFNADVILSITGNAGPQPDEDKPIGLSYLTIILIDKVYTYELHSTEIERNNIRVDFTYQALTKLLNLLKSV
ncbi:MAG: CinA family protein [Mycoplasmataceae bacterium]|jgi:PncC family amidohydrolase|nr:CinA family protein [Mycoplasmataceae bacterium]